MILIYLLISVVINQYAIANESLIILEHKPATMKKVHLLRIQASF